MKPFWQTKSLEEMNEQEWESLCDGCGRCCLYKLEDEDTGEIHYTTVACRYLDLDSSRCQCYAQRLTLVPECLQLSPQQLEPLAWLPESCAYKRIAQGKPLLPWHPLVSGNKDSIHQAGISVCSHAVREEADMELEEYLIVLDTPCLDD